MQAKPASGSDEMAPAVQAIRTDLDEIHRLLGLVLMAFSLPTKKRLHSDEDDDSLARGE